MNQKDRNKQILLKQIRQIELHEKKLLVEKQPSYVSQMINPVWNRLHAIVPSKLKSTMEQAFYKGFQLIFDKGIPYIEKTYQKDKLQLEYDINNYAISKKPSKKYLKKIDKNTSRARTINSSISVVEGGVLGLLGIGLPDIPIFLSVLIRSLQEIAISYGYTSDKEEEKIFLLTVISAALSPMEDKKEHMESVDIIGVYIDVGKALEVPMEDRMEDTCDLLAEALLAAKFIQGIPILGVVGGAINPVILRKVTQMAKLKYKKRYLYQKLREISPEIKD